MKRGAFLLLAALAALLLVVSCARRQTGVKLDAETLAQIKEGETTKQQVLARLGPPNITNRHDGIEYFTYTYTNTEVSGKSFIPIAGAFLGGHSSEHQFVTISFDKAGIVQSVSQQEGAHKSGY